MALRTVKSSGKKTEERTSLTTKEKIDKLRVHQQPLFEYINEPKAFYQPKMKYNEAIIQAEAVTFFPIEMERGVDIYTEFVSRDYLSEDTTRTLYKWTFDPNYQTKYRITIPNATGQYRFIIPIKDLVKIGRPELVDSPNQKLIEFNSSKPKEDIPLKDMTVRDYAAIIWRKPISNKDWINEMVTESKTQQ